jgi:hypothetical protein
MNEFIDLDKLHVESAKFQHVVEENKTQDAIEVLKQIQSLFEDHINSIVITNYKKYGAASQNYYVLRIKREKIEIAEQGKTIKNHIVFNLESKEIQLNNKVMSNIFFHELRKRINQILNDINKNRSQIFEEIID